MQNTTIHSPLPDTPTHVKHAVAVLGVDADLAYQVTEWQDRAWKTHFLLHRWYDDHDPIQSPIRAKEIFGPRADEIARLHILEDAAQNVTIFNEIVWLGLAGTFVAGILLVDGQRKAKL